MELKFRVAARIAKPVHEVFEAVADPAKLSNYFTTGGAEGRLETGATVTWDFHDFPGAFPVYVTEVVPDEKIVLDSLRKMLALGGYSIDTVESGKMTKDLALLISKDAPWLNTQEFLAAIDDNLKKAMA